MSEKDLVGLPTNSRKGHKVPQRFKKMSEAGGLQVWGQRWTKRSESGLPSGAQVGELHLEDGSLTYTVTPQELPNSPHLSDMCSPWSARAEQHRVYANTDDPANADDANAHHNAHGAIELIFPYQSVGLANVHSPAHTTPAQELSVDLPHVPNCYAGNDSYSLLYNGRPRSPAASTAGPDTNTRSQFFYTTSDHAPVAEADHCMRRPSTYQAPIPLRHQRFSEADLIQQLNSFPPLGHTRDTRLNGNEMEFSSQQEGRGPMAWQSFQSSHNYVPRGNEVTPAVGYASTFSDHSDFMPGYISSSRGIPPGTISELENSHLRTGHMNWHGQPPLSCGYSVLRPAVDTYGSSSLS